MSDIAQVLAFWFAPEQAAKWWVRDPAFDQLIRERFGRLHAAAADGALDHWAVTPHGALVLVILLDQFSRNLYRDDPRAFANDPHALALALTAIDRGFDLGLPRDMRDFFHLPLMHAEDLAMQERCCRYYADADADSRESAEEHRATITRFGRFPYRNAALGRSCTPEELTYLTARSYDAVAEEYARRIAGELAGKPFDRALLDRFAAAVKGLVWEVGCGPGHIAAYLRDRGADVVGLDLSPRMVAQAKALHPGLTFRQGDMTALDAADGSLAGIVAFYALIHLTPQQVAKALAEFHRVLRSGGLLLIAVHAGSGSIHLDQWWEKSVSIDTHFFQAAQLAREVAAAGFQIEELTEREPYPEIEYPSRRAYLLARRNPL